MSNPEALALANSYRDTVLSASILAAAGINPLLDNVEGLDFKAWTREVRPAMLEIGTQFAMMTSELSAAYYDEARTMFPPNDGNKYKAAMLINPKDNLSAYRDNIAYTFNSVGNARSYDAVKSNVFATMGDFVRKSSFDNMVENAKRDKSLVIITYVPSSKACRFCRSLIAMGRKSYRSVEGEPAYGGSAWMAAVFKNNSIFHKRCACTPMPRFVGNGKHDYDTTGQEVFNKDFQTVTKQAEKLGMMFDKPQKLVSAMQMYQESYRMGTVRTYVDGKPKDVPTRKRVVDTEWKRIQGPKFDASEAELLKMKNAVAGNGGKPFKLPLDEAKK